MKLLLLGALLLTSFSAVAAECVPASPSQIERVRSAMELQLLDAESARYKDVCVVPHHAKMAGKQAYCGLVNAKNSYGAFTGYTEFSYVENAEQATIIDPMDKAFTKRYFRCTVCTPEKNCDALLNN